MAQARYRYRLYPTAAQRDALARGFGCCRVVFNDVVALREKRYRDGLPSLSDAEVSRLVTTVAKRTPERAWLTEVPAAALQAAVRDANAAYRNYFDSAAGRRKGPRIARPRFRTRRDRRQTMRFTKATGFKITAEGRLRLPTIGEVNVVWSRTKLDGAIGIDLDLNAARAILAAGLAERRNGCGTVEDLLRVLRGQASVQTQAQQPAEDCEEAAITTAARQVATWSGISPGSGERRSTARIC